MGGLQSRCGKQALCLRETLRHRRKGAQAEGDRRGKTGVVLRRFFVADGLHTVSLLRMCRNVQFEIIRGGGLRPPQKAKITIILKHSQLQIIVAAEAGDLRHG